MRRRRCLAGVGAALAVGLAGCGGIGGEAAVADSGLGLSATPFDDGGTIPPRYTCDGGDVNPELTVSGVPDAAETLALVVDDSEGQRPSGREERSSSGNREPQAPGDSRTESGDPDAGESPFVHWTLWNVPASTETIPRSVAKQPRPPFAEGARQGQNDAGEVGYVGPCPPVGDDPHTYRFRLSAVDTTLDLAAGASPAELAEALSGHVVAEVTLTGRYNRD